MILGLPGSLQHTQSLLSFDKSPRFRSTRSLHRGRTSCAAGIVGPHTASFRFCKRVNAKLAPIRAAIIDTMPEAQPDVLFAAAMPKEEIGALTFLKACVTSLVLHTRRTMDFTRRPV